MGIWRMDRKTAIYIAEHIWEMDEEFPLMHCDKCDSDYLEKVGHEHNDYIDLETHDVTEDDVIEPMGKHSKIIPKYEQEREAIWDNMFDVLKGD